MKKQNGQSLIEVVVAVGISVIILAGLISAVIVAVKNAQFAKNQALATKYAEEGMETSRLMRDADWNSFWGKVGTTERISISSLFSKAIKYEDASAGYNNKMKVTVTVSWTDVAGSHKSELVSYFTKW